MAAGPTAPHSPLLCQPKQVQVRRVLGRQEARIVLHARSQGGDLQEVRHTGLSAGVKEPNGTPMVDGLQIAAQNPNSVDHCVDPAKTGAPFIDIICCKVYIDRLACRESS
jgi:hypothetical protein